jgi:DNA (cytosine-5)-methyltransferase 1
MTLYFASDWNPIICPSCDKEVVFAGIGGFDLGLERTGGFKTVAFCEIEPFGVSRFSANIGPRFLFMTMSELTAEACRRNCSRRHRRRLPLPGHFARRKGALDWLASAAAYGAEYARLVGELRPVYVIVENVAALLSRGLGDVLGDLAALGYDAEWHCIPASAVGAPHRRDRIWILAYPECQQQRQDAVQNGRGTAWQGRPRPTGAKVQARLQDAAAFWPTPRANDAEKRGNINPND